MTPAKRRGPNTNDPEASFRDGKYEFKLFVLPVGISFRPALAMDPGAEFSAAIGTFLYEGVWGWFKLRLDHRFKVLLMRRPADSFGGVRFAAVYFENTLEAANERRDLLVRDWRVGLDYTGDDIPTYTSKEVRRMVRETRKRRERS